VLEPLTDQFELFTYSLPGHHDTPLPKGQYGEAELTEQLRALMLREGVAKAHIAGIPWAVRWPSISPAPARRWWIG